MKRNEKRCREEKLVRSVREVFEEYYRVYGCGKLLFELNNRKVDVNEYKLRRIMRENGLYAVVCKKFKPYKLGKSDGLFASNIIQRNFTPFGLNQYWRGDITYIRTYLGWVYLAVVLDLCNKEVIGYAISKNIDTELVKNAFGNAAMESFFASLKKELIYRKIYANIDEVREDVFKYIEIFYNLYLNHQ